MYSEIDHERTVGYHSRHAQKNASGMGATGSGLGFLAVESGDLADANAKCLEEHVLNGFRFEPACECVDQC